MANHTRTPLADRFWPKVLKTAGCWLWLGAVNPKGYGNIAMGGRGGGTALAHRVAYELLVGPIPTGLTLDHGCRNTSCVNPAHLEPVTMQVNILRGDGASARCAAKTHCPSGHPYDESNTWYSKTGARYCRACWAARRKGAA